MKEYKDSYLILGLLALYLIIGVSLQNPLVMPNGMKMNMLTGQKCKKDVVSLLELPDAKSLCFPSEERLEICPHITQSCCDPVDAQIFTENWNSIAEPRLNHVLSIQKKIYFDLLTVLEKVSIKAKSVLYNTRGRLDNNCIIMARRLFNYRVEEENRLIKLIVEEFHTSIKDIFRSTYCNLCNLKSHQYINTSKGELTISRDTCREFGYSSLQFLLYFYIDIIGLVNLANIFANTCTENATYDEKRMPDKHLFQIDTDIRQRLENAKENRNEPKWFEHFAPICGELKMGEMTQFFMPNVEKFGEYTAYMNDVLDGKETVTTTASTSIETTVTVTQQNPNRLLIETDPDKTDESTQDIVEKEDTETKDEITEKSDEIDKKETDTGEQSEDISSLNSKKEELNPHRSFKIYHVDNTKNTKIDGLRIVVGERGLDLIEVGRSSNFIEPRKLVHKKKLKSNRKSGLKDRKLGAHSRFLRMDKKKDISIMTISSLILILSSLFLKL